MLQIGPYQHESRVIVAPMAGVTDQPWRNICRSLGAYWVVSEMVTSDSRLWHTPKSARRLQYHDEADPRWIQIAGADPAMMVAAATFNADRGAQIIDINMGCPAKKVCNRAAGSALLKDETLVARILSSVVAAVSVPVTLKMRLGWSRDAINATRIARIAESCGVQLITVHGRTRACKFAGSVDYDAIGEVKGVTGIPVIANGDIDSPHMAERVLQITGCDGVMVGRAAQGRPWLAATIDHYLRTGEIQSSPDQQAVQHLLIAHVTGLHQFYGETVGVRVARKHVSWYLRDESTAGFQRDFNRLESADAQIGALHRVFDIVGVEVPKSEQPATRDGNREDKERARADNRQVA